MSAAAVAAPRRRHYAATLAALSLLTLSNALIQTAVAPALPAIQHDLGVATTSVTWVLTVTGLLFAVATPIVGRLGDIFGRHRTLSFVVAATCLGCLVAALSHSLGLLVAGRALQGMGGSTFALAFAIARDELPPARRAAGFGLISATYGVGGVAGYPLSGVIVDHLSYEWIFWFGLIAVGVTGLAARLSIPASPIRAPAPIDWLGSLLLAAGLGSALLGVSEGVHWGWASPGVLGLIAAGSGLLAAWARWEVRVAAPVVDLRLFRLRGIWTANASGVTLTFGFFTVLLLVPKLVEAPRSLGYGFGASVTGASYYLIPMAGVLLLASPVAGFVVGRAGGRMVAIAGSFAGVAGLAALAGWHETTWQIALATGLVGLGVAFNLTSASSLIAHAAPHAQIGEAMGMSSTVRAGGGAIGGQVSATVVSTALVAGTAFPTAGAYTLAFAIAAGIAAFSIVSSLLVPRPQAEAVLSRAPATAA